MASATSAHYDNFDNFAICRTSVCGSFVCIDIPDSIKVCVCVCDLLNESEVLATKQVEVTSR